jgi:hypothetical protein
MTKINLTSRAASLGRRAGALAAVGLACATVAAAPAAAQPVGPTGGARGCPVEDEHGNVTYVPAGTTYLLWHCGADGEWHFGTVTTNVVKPAPVAVAAPIAIAPPVLTR